MSLPRVLVVGGGVGGLSSAVALRAHGFDVDVVERSGRVVRDTVTLTGRCVDALADLDVLRECRARGNAPGSVFVRSFDVAGEPFDQGTPKVPHSAMPPTVVIERPALIDILTSAARTAGVKIELPRTVTAIEQLAGQASVTFDNGDTTDYGLVVGADGVHSTVRDLMWPGGVTATPAGAVGLHWQSTGLPEGDTGFYYRPGGIVTVGRLPGDVTYVSTFVDTDDPVTDDLGRDLLRETLDIYSSPFVHALRERLDDEQPVAVRPWEWVFAQEWCRGRVILVGDAAHATTHWLPAGAGLALIDAVVLGEELGEAADIPTGLSAFVARRWERAQLVVQASLDAMRLRRAGDHAAARVVVNGALRELVGPY